MNYYKVTIYHSKLPTKIHYYKFESNVAWVREENSKVWYQSGIYANEKHFQEWINRGTNKSVKLTKAELFIELI